MIYNMRIQKFMQKTMLKKRQRDIVQYFMRYVIENHEIKMGEIAKRSSTADQLVKDMQPTTDDFDRKILYEIAKRRVDIDDYIEDTSFEEDSEEEKDDDGHDAATSPDHVVGHHEVTDR